MYQWQPIGAAGQVALQGCASIIDRRVDGVAAVINDAPVCKGHRSQPIDIVAGVTRSVGHAVGNPGLPDDVGKGIVNCCYF